ncbi:hypothetical protein KIH86_07585 [Paenibacillus sp. HN-1]|uniref:hypothetical protein n=1 Tax=Paenibacillus TaxID=44249 RepID=UPI001CA7DCB2|nr:MULTISPECIES: hypothetical protein [Paenibacillus]MBY9080999.1 hypothetical protein [Paenibacillus sp. CGMCC 1.18879]MBY9084101.1 hypothetical protein [Paenibacillus sinensis]
MAFGTNAREHMRRKQAGSFAIIQTLARQAEGEMKSKAFWRDRTTTARRALHAGAEPMGGGKIRMYFAHGVKYGIYLEEGTRPHTILPKNKKALYWRGASSPVRRVKHPGTKPYPIVSPTAKRYKQKAKQALVKWWSMR